MSEAGLTLEQVQERITRGPFNSWLNFTVTKVDADGLEVKAGWREEWVVNPDRRYTHGGILSAIIDVAADYAIAAQIGRPVQTIDLRVDFHKAAMPGDLTAKARVVRLGSQVPRPPKHPSTTRKASWWRAGGERTLRLLRSLEGVIGDWCSTIKRDWCRQHGTTLAHQYAVRHQSLITNHAVWMSVG